MCLIKIALSTETSTGNKAANVLKNKGAGPAQVKSAVIALLRQYSKGEKIV